jgi:hypothetical protein
MISSSSTPNKVDFDHLATTLRAHYGITKDMTASKFCGITLQWNYKEGHVILSMPGYVEKALHRFTHQTPQGPSNGSHQPMARTTQYAPEEDTTLSLDANGIKCLQEVIDTFLFLARAVDNTMLVALGTLAAAQTKGTENTMDALIHLLDYAATHPDAAIRFHKSAMILYVHGNRSYLSKPKARSRVGYFYLGSPNEAVDNPKPNEPIHVKSHILKNVMAVASEAKIAALFHTDQETVHITNVLL